MCIKVCSKNVCSPCESWSEDLTYSTAYLSCWNVGVCLFFKPLQFSAPLYWDIISEFPWWEGLYVEYFDQPYRLRMMFWSDPFCALLPERSSMNTGLETRLLKQQIRDRIYQYIVTRCQLKPICSTNGVGLKKRQTLTFQQDR